MTDLRLAVKLTLDKSGFAPGADESARAVEGIGAATRRAAGDARAMGGVVVEATRSIASAADAQTRAVTTIADAVTRAKATISRDALGTPIARSAAEAAAETARFGAALDALRARWDPLAAATARYNGLLGELQAAHAAGAIGGALLVQRQADLKIAYERTTAAMADQGRAAKLAVERSVAGQTIRPDRGADIAAYGAELDALRGKYNPVWAAGRQYRATVDEIARAERVGAITTAEAAAARARARVETRASVEALRAAKGATDAHAGSMKLSAFQAQNLSYQMHDVVVSLASGMNPLTVLLQQGSQITPLFGGIGGTLTAIANLVTPARLGIALLATGAGVVAKSMADFAARTREADVAARGIGRGAGTSAGEIAVISRRYAAAGDVSIDRARSMATEFTRTGRIGSEQFGRLISIGKDFSATIGADVDAGTRQLADIFADPARGAETLANSFHLIDQSSARAIRRIAETGDTSAAQTALLDALDGRLVKNGQTIAWYQKLWEEISDPKTPGGSLGAALGEKSPQERLASLQSQYVSVQRAVATGDKVGPLGMDIGPWLAKAEAEIETLQRLIDRAERIGAGNAAAARVDRARTVAVDLADKAPANDESTRRISLEKELAALRRGEAAPNNTAEERERIARAIDADTRALSTWISEAERARELDRLDLALMATRDPIERASLEAERARVQMRGQAIATTEAAAAGERAYARSIGEVSAQARGSVTDLSAVADARRRINDLVASGVISNADAAREVQIEAQTRHLLALAARAEGTEKEHLIARAGELRAAIIAQSEADKRAVALQTTTAGRDRIETQQTELGLVGRVEAERRKVLALLQVEQEIRRQGLDTTSAEAEQIRALADAEAELTDQVDRRRRALEMDRGKQLDRIDLSVAATRDPIERASLEAERARIQARSQGLDETEAAAAGERAYARSIGEVSAQARGSIVDITADAAARAKVNALIASGAIASADATREIQIETQTRQLLTAAARAEGAEKERRLGLASQLRTAITAQAEAEKQAQALQDLQSGRDRTEMLRTEIALIGQAEPVRARTLALLEAEQKIRNQGLSGPIAAQLRAEAVAAADLTTALERQKSAWEGIKSTGGGAIDTLVEGLRTGKDVGASLAEDLSKELLKLSVSNPLKNWAFGENLPTIAEAGGLLGSLLGGTGTAGIGAIVPSAVGTATITAATVIVNGGVGGIAGAAAGAANAVGVYSGSILNRSGFDAELSNPSIRSRLFAMTQAEVGGQGADAQQAFMETIFNRASARGMSLDRVLGDRAYFPAETFARADRLVGSPQLDEKYADMLARVRGGSNLSAWATGNASGSVGFGGGPQTFSAGGERFGIEQPDLAWAARQKDAALQASNSLTGLADKSGTAVDALGQFGTGTTQAAQALTQGGGGIAAAGQTMTTSITTTATTTQSAFGQLTSGLVSAITSLLSALGNLAGSGISGLGGLLGGLLGGGGGGAAPSYGGLYESGGYTGSIGRTSIAGLVHGEEFVVRADATAKHRPLLEAINAGFAIPGYASGGYVGAAPRLAVMPARGGDTPPAAAHVLQTTINNYSSSQVTTREEDDGRGGRRQVVTIEEAVGRAVSRPRSATQRALATAYGLQTKVIRR